MRKWLLPIFIALHLCIAQAQVYAQNIPMLHYTVENGLPSNRVYGLLRDSKGFLWIGTDKGVARYNGMNFEVFTTFNGLADNEVFFFNEDKSGRIWMSTYNGKLCYYKDGIFHNEKNTPFLKLPFKTTYISVITAETDGTMTFNFFDQKYMVNVEGDKLHVFDLENSASFHNDKQRILYSTKPSRDKYLVYMTDGETYIDTNGHTIKTIQYPHARFRTVMSMEKRYFMDDTSVYNSSYKEVYKFKGHFRDKNYINSMFFIDSLAFILSTNGVFYNDSICLINDVSASAMYDDIEGNYWLGTLNNGLYCIQKGFEKTKEYNGVYNGTIKYAFAKNRHVFYTTDVDDLYALTENGTRKIYDSKLREHNINPSSIESSQLIDDSFNYYYFHSPTNVILKDITKDHPTIATNHVPAVSYAVKAIFSLPGKIYTKQRYRILGFNTADFGKKSFRYNYITDSTATERILGMAMAPDRSLWYSTIFGVNKITNDKSSIQPQFKENVFRSFVFAGCNIVGYTLDNMLLVCSNVESHIIMDTLPAQNCIWDKLIVLDSNHILITTNNLYRVLTITKENGRNQFDLDPVDNPFVPANAEAICIDGNDCYFFKGGSAIKLDMGTLLKDPAPPILSFKTVKENGKRWLITDNVTIPYENKSVSISFSAISFTGRNIIYEYSVSKNGADNWQPLKTEQIDLFNPSFGTYVVKVRARSVSGSFCKPIAFTLQIARPFWATWWFIVICITAFATYIVMLIRYRIRKTVLKNDAENEHKIKFMKSEYKALNALMNPHFIFNTLNNVQGLINSNDRLAANEYLRIFADMIRQNMHNISKELIPLTKEIELVENYLLLEKLRFKDLLNYTITIDDDVDASLILVPPLLIQPLVENSIKHGILPQQSPDSMILVNVYEKSDTLFIEVKDNGVGMNSGLEKSDTMHESFGLNNIRGRITQLGIILNKKISFDITETEEKGARWTVVTISMQTI